MKTSVISKIGVAALALSGVLLCGANASAAPITGTFSTQGDVTGVGPWTLTTTGANDFGFLGFVFDTPVVFTDLTQFIVNFESLAGGGGGGAPRGRIQLDTNNDNIADGSISVHLGTSPNYIDTPASLNAFSGTNYIGNNDAGRYDTSAFAGGNNFSTYANAIALLGTAKVLRLGVVVDTFLPFPDYTIRIDSISAADSSGAAPVPEPASLVLLGSGLVGFVVRRRLKARR